jgi:membrane-associated protein
MMHAALAALTEPPALPMLALWHLHVMEHVQHWMSAAGYPVLFGLLFSCGVGLPLPEDVPLLFAGYFVATGEMHLVPAAICAWCGIIGGDCVLYAIGRRFGDGITRVPLIGRHIKQEQIGKLHDQFERYGVWVVAIGRLFAGVRGAMVLVAGMIRFTFSHFIIADGLAAIFSGGLFMALGYYAGRKVGDLKQVHQEIERYSTWILLGVIATAIVVVGWVWWRKRRRARRRGFEVAAPRDAAPPAAAAPAVPADAPVPPPA